MMSAPSITAQAHDLTPEQSGAYIISGDPDTSIATPDTEREENVGEAEDVATDEPERKPLFGGLTAQEAGRRSAQRRRERDLAGDTDSVHSRSDETRTVRCTIETGKVIEKLAKDAKGGNVQAARELRGWLQTLPVETATEISALDKRTRAQVLLRLLSEIEAEEGVEQS